MVDFQMGLLMHRFHIYDHNSYNAVRPTHTKGWQRNLFQKNAVGIDSEWFPLNRGRNANSEAFRGLRKTQYRGSEGKEMA